MFLIKSCYLHLDNPIEKWVEINEKQEKIANFLNSKSKIRIIGDKTDITFNVSGRTWKSCAGECNFPDGEVYTSPIEDSANGQIYFDFPQIYRGNEAQKVLLTVENGKIIDAKAEKRSSLLKTINGTFNNNGGLDTRKAFEHLEEGIAHSKEHYNKVDAMPTLLSTQMHVFAEDVLVRLGTEYQDFLKSKQEFRNRMTKN